MIDARTLCVAAMAVSLVHGLVPTPVFAVVVAWSPLWWPFAFAPTQALLIYATALIVSIATLLLAGAPAALYERLAGHRETTTGSALIWLGATLLLTGLGIATRG
jgi:hypothetical protein